MKSAIGHFATRHAASILFLVAALCAAGGYAAWHMPSSVFPQVNFPRVIVMAEDGVTPANEMMAAVTRPIEEAMKDIPGCKTVRSATARGSTQVDVFFTWDVDMVQAELYVNSRLSNLRASLPPTASTQAYRMTFAAFPILGLSLTSETRDPTETWETARYNIKPQLLRVPGVATVELVGGHPPEYRVTADLDKLGALHLSLAQVIDAIRRNNQIVPATLHEQDHSLYLTAVDGRLHSADDVANLTVPTPGGTPVRIGSFATVDRGAEPSFSRVTADGAAAVLLNVYAQPDASTVDIADGVAAQLRELHKTLPRDIKVGTFYDQSLFVRGSRSGVWEAIVFGLVLSVAIVFLFLRNWGSTLVATIVIPVSVLVTVLAMKLCGMTFNLMTLGGIAAAIGLVIDDAIVVVEAIFAKIGTGLSRPEAVRAAVADIFEPLLGSTLTPVVVFVPLAFLDGIAGVFFRALALTMAVALLTSLALALTLTPSLASWLVRGPRRDATPELQQAANSGLAMRAIIRLYEVIVRRALTHRWFTAGLALLILFGTVVLYSKLETDFLPAMDEGGFVIDYVAPPGTSLSEIDRQLVGAEKILRATPEVESYSRRAGTALGVHLVEPNTGDFLVKLKGDRKRTTAQVIADVRERFNVTMPRTQWDFPGVLSDLIGDLTWADEPIEIKLLSTDIAFLQRKALDVEKAIGKVPGVVDVLNGVIFTGPSLTARVRPADAQRYGLTVEDIGSAVKSATLGQSTSSVLEKDRLVNVRVRAEPRFVERAETLAALPLLTASGTVVPLKQVADVAETPGELELHRDDLRQALAVTSQLEGRDLGSAMAEIRNALAKDPELPPGTVEFGGLYEQQQDSFRKLTVVLSLAIVLVFAVALLEFRSFSAPIAIVFGAALSTFGIVAALNLTGTSVSIVTFLGAIIGMGIVHKNGILMLDYVEHLRAGGMGLYEALVYSGRRRLRPVLMTSLAAALGMLPLAYGLGSGADMLRPMAIAVIGAVCTSVLLSLVATPTIYFLLFDVSHRLWARSAEPVPADSQPGSHGFPLDEATLASGETDTLPRDDG